MHACPQVLRFKRFRHVVISAELQSLQTTLNSRLGGQKDNRNIIDIRILLNELRQFQTVHIRHHQVRNNQINRFLEENLLRLYAITRTHDVVVVAHDIDQEIAHVLTIIYDENRPFIVLLFLL